MKTTEVKIGSIVLTKEYNFFKRMWAKFLKKELPYNHFYLINDSGKLVENDYVKKAMLCELKKAYNKKEIAILQTLLESNESLSEKDLFAVINTVRPGTFEEGTDNLNLLVNSKYYNIKNLSDESIWKKEFEIIYIY